MATAPATVVSPYTFAAAPDMIRSHQKDAYFTGHLTNSLTDVYRRLLGARSAHALAPELRTAASLLYFGLTTLPGNRTLGEEYCDLVQLEGATGRLPSVGRRAGYILGSVVVPYLVSRGMPDLRQRLRRLIEARIQALTKRDEASAAGGVGRERRVWEYILAHLSALTSSAPVQAVVLAVFYFRGTYYQLSKRLLGLRYVFTRDVPDTPDRAGYEVLGVLLVIQLAVQAYLHVRTTLRENASNSAAADDLASNDDSLLLGSGAGGQTSAAAGSSTARIDIAAATHTPLTAPDRPRHSLADEKVMAYIRGAQQRKCTLCLDELRDPAATQCGHVFCWECIGDWVREKPECPLCRREAMVQHILPLRAV